jgi:hypothetical protein
MATRTRRRGGKSRCTQCGHPDGVYGCDGVVSKDPWRICNRAICERCRVHVPAGADYCRPCAIERGLVAREVGEEG